MLLYIFIGIAVADIASEDYSDNSYYEDDYDYIDEDELDYETSDSTTKSHDTYLCGSSFQLEDQSVIYFEEDGSFYWYQSNNNLDDNYYYGTYEEYHGEDAVDYVTGLSKYHVTEDELDAYFERNEGDDFYSVDNYCCMVLHNDELVIDGENTLDTSYDTPYMGFYSDGVFDATNMNTGDYTLFEIIN